MAASFAGSMADLIVGLERGVLPKLDILEDLLDRVVDARSGDTAKMGPDLWSLCTKLDKKLDSRIAGSEDFSQIYCALHLLAFRLYQSEGGPMDMQSGLALFIVALKALGQLIKHHWSRPSTAFGDKIWNPKTYDELLACLSTVFKVVLQQSFLFKSGSTELLQQIFMYHVIELKLLFIRIYETKNSGVLLDRLAYAASFYRKGDQQDAIIHLVLEGIAIRPYRQSLYKTNLSFIDSVFRILKQMFELKVASKQSLSNILRTFADASILTALMKAPISVGYSVDFCITKSQELYPWPLADAVLRVKRTVHSLTTARPTHTHIESCQQIDNIIQDALGACSRVQDTSDTVFAGLASVLSFLAENGFLSSAVRAAKNIIDRSLTGLLTFNERTDVKSSSPFRSMQQKDSAFTTGVLRNNQLYATKIACLILDIIILAEGTVGQQEIISVLPTLGCIFKVYIDDGTAVEYEEMANTLHNRLFYLLTSLISRGDIPCLQLLNFVHSIECHPRSIILVVQHALTEIETLCKKTKTLHYRSSSSLSTPSQDGGEAAKELLASLIDQSTSLLRDAQQFFNDKSIPNTSLVEEYGITRYEFYYLFISILLYGQDVDSAIQLTKHLTALLEIDESLKISDLEVLASIVGLYVTRQYSVGGPLTYSSGTVTSILAAMLQALTKRYLCQCTMHNKYLRLIIEYSIGLAQELIQTGSQSPEVSCKMFTQARETVETYTDRVGVSRFMPHELEALQCALYKLFIAGYSSIINKDRIGDASVSIYDVIALYKILLSFTTAIEEKEPPIKRSFSIIHREGSKDSVDSIYSSTSLRQHGSQEALVTASFFTELNINLSAGLILCSADLSSQKSSIIRKSVFVGIVCQHVLSWTTATDEQINIVMSMLSTLGNYLSIVSVIPDLEEECLWAKTVQCGAQSVTLIPIPNIFKLIHQLKQQNDISTSQIFTVDVPLARVAYYYVVLLVVVTAKVFLIRQEKYSTAFAAILAGMDNTKHRDLLAKLMEHTLGLTLEVNCRPVSNLLLEKYKTLDPVSCVYIYTTSSSNIEVDVLVALLTALAEAGERDPEILTNDKVQQITSRLDKGPIQNAALNQVLTRLRASMRLKN